MRFSEKTRNRAFRFGLIAAPALFVASACGDQNLKHADQSQNAAVAGGAISFARSFDVRLRPIRDNGGEITAIDVQSTLSGFLTPDSGPFSLAAPVVYAGVAGIADRVEGLTVADAEGAVPLVQEDDPAAPGGFPYFRHWRAQREVSFPVTISYRSLVQPAGARNGPPFGIRPSAGGVSGAGSGFLVVPENTDSSASHVAWDLSGMAEGSAGIASFGEGESTLKGPPRELMQAWYMAGPVGRYPDSGDVDGFSAAWLGDFPFDERIEMERAGEIYAFLGEFFEYLDPPPRYRVFMRLMQTPPYGGGTALPNSFMLSRGPAQPADAGSEGPRGVFFHEMIHQWVGGIEGPQGVTSWFSEGLTTYYTNLLPMRGGFATVDDYGAGINATARAYYTNPARNWTAQRIAETGFGDEAVRHRPYQLGALYFADLDSKLRAASGGKRTLHRFVRETFSRRESEEGFTFDQAKWKELVSAEIGPDAGDYFDQHVIEGKTLIPAPDAFGPCFERRAVKFETEDGSVDGFEWTRVAAVSDEECRKY